MKIALVQEFVDATRGGAETSTRQLADALTQEGAAVELLSAETLGTPTNGSRLALTRSFLDDVQQRCRTGGFDLVHAITPFTCADVYQPRGGTYVETIARSTAMIHSPVERFVRQLARRFNRRQRFLLGVESALLTRAKPPLVAAVSDYVRRQVEAAYPGVPRERIRVIFNGVSIEPLESAEAARRRAALRAELALYDETPLLLFVAHNFKLKGLPELLHALALGSVQWVLLVVGRDDPARYQGLVERYSLVPRVRFLGPVQDIRSYYAAADVLVHPTWYDPCSRVVLEALSCGLPAVTTRHNGASEAIDTGRRGEVVDDPADAPALAAAIERALSADVRSACRADAPTIRQRLSMKRHARELIELYREAIAAR